MQELRWYMGLMRDRDVGLYMLKGAHSEAIRRSGKSVDAEVGMLVHEQIVIAASAPEDRKVQIRIPADPLLRAEPKYGARFSKVIGFEHSACKS
jgi:hypothetical protein